MSMTVEGPAGAGRFLPFSGDRSDPAEGEAVAFEVELDLDALDGLFGGGEVRPKRAKSPNCTAADMSPRIAVMNK